MLSDDSIEIENWYDIENGDQDLDEHIKRLCPPSELYERDDYDGIYKNNNDLYVSICDKEVPFNFWIDNVNNNDPFNKFTSEIKTRYYY